jgi:beta-lactamase superfamily II metal-dependent hydrolase
MGYEIDFLSVGEESQSGDAIIIRWGGLFGPRSAQSIAIVDGGFQTTGEKIVAFVKERFGTDVVDYVISTHPDADHANGLLVVLEELRVGNLLMHRPWKTEHTNNIADLFKSGRVTDKSVRERLQRSLDTAVDLESAAKARDIPITEPFAGVQTADGCLRILGPTEAFYESLLPGFRGTPQPKESLFESLQHGVRKAGSAAMTWVEEALAIETLTDKDDTTPENNSSAVILLSVDGRNSLLTADAGKAALGGVLDRLDAEVFDFSSLTFAQVPHHGSRRNVGPTLLNRLLGPNQPVDTKTRTAFVSASPKGAPKHPSKKVCNAFRRRGAYVYGTAGTNIWHHYDAPERPDYSSLNPHPLYAQVEE